jgi:branched-subunit amino acid aminotransferase/4-amino-4-deoxychorismate lyase
LRYTRIDIQLTAKDLTRIADELVAHNGRLLDKGDELGLIYFITPGEYRAYAPAPARTAPTVCVHTFALPFELWAAKLRTGAHVITPSIRHIPPQCVDPKMKYRSRMHYYLADKEAQLVDSEAIALLLDLEGNITETGGANFLMVERGAIVSPRPRNILPGVSLRTVTDLAAQLGFAFVERDIQVFDIVNADEAFLASTPYCLMPVTRINGISIADGNPGPIYRRLMRAWSELVGLDIEQQTFEGAARRQAGKGPHATR